LIQDEVSVSKKPSRNTRKARTATPARPPILVKHTGERLVANEYAQLQKERDKLQAQIAEIDGKLRDMRSARQHELLAELKELGWSPSGAGPGRKTASSGRKRKSSSDAVCPICQVPGHDGRAHRSQGKNKKPFTKEELRERGLATA